MRTSRAVVRLAAGVGLAFGLGSALGQGGSPLQVRYDFAIEVNRNLVIDNGLSGQFPELAALPVGTVGLFSMIASETEAAPSSQPEVAYRTIISASLDIGPISVQTDPAVHPSSTQETAFRVTDNRPFTFGKDFPDLLIDELNAVPVFANAPFMSAGLSALQVTDVSMGIPDLLTSTSLPPELDFDQPDRGAGFLIVPDTASRSSVSSIVTDVTITVIPAPASVAMLAPVALGAARRRRE